MIGINNKRGFLLGEQTIKIVLAVLGILVLVYLLFSLYSVFKTNKDKEQAKAIFDKLIEKINLAKTEKQTQTLLTTSPSRFFLMSYPFKESSKGPEACKDENGVVLNCICICPTIEISQCNKYDICKRLDNKVHVIGRLSTTIAILEDISELEISFNAEENQYEIKEIK